ncbi:DNA (cytosine-5-)-methyltransferase [Gammaproteobacteria bacterium]|nr:DNA (cytosine-5-)-methyltransferase [Gammaproteobacteria bacterium]
MPTKLKKISIISMFSGCGGMDLGFLGGFNFLGKRYKKLDTEIVWCNELNPEACKTYKKNISQDILEGDVWENLTSVPKKIDLLIGGFPCQDISVNNKNAKGVEGDRSGLYRAMIEVAKISNPQMIIAENVKGLLNKNNAPSLKKVIDDFSMLGFNVQYKLYNSANFGVPQTRERVFIVGTKKGEFIHPSEPLDSCNWVTAKDAIHDLVDREEDLDWSHIWSKAKKNNASQGNRALKSDRPGYTIRAECHGNTHYHYDLPRRMSLRESARIQSFPDQFIFRSKMRETERQIGNAVPPVLAWHLANNVIKFLNSKP